MVNTQKAYQFYNLMTLECYENCIYPLLNSFLFKSASQNLSDEQNQWIKTIQDKVYQLIRETPPDGEQFCKIVQVCSTINCSVR